MGQLTLNYQAAQQEFENAAISSVKEGITVPAFFTANPTTFREMIHSLTETSEIIFFQLTYLQIFTSLRCTTGSFSILK